LYTLLQMMQSMDEQLDDYRNLMQIYFNNVVEYAERTLGYTVLEDSDCVDCCRNDVKIIEIYSLNGVESRLFALLHECGHALIRRDWTKFKTEFCAHAEHDGDGRKETKSLKISTLEEEFEAWKRGWKLAKRLNLQLDKDAYTKHKNKYIMTYIEWAAN
jgi:Zn-dependent M32 family carboxypeptidase